VDDDRDNADNEEEIPLSRAGGVGSTARAGDNTLPGLVDGNRVTDYESDAAFRLRNDFVARCTPALLAHDVDDHCLTWILDS
jgi:hypothetical protein